MSKPRAFELKPDRVGWGKLNSIEATHAYKLPGVHCPNCGIWSATGVIYPCIDESALLDILAPASKPVSVEQFQKLVSELIPLIGSDRPILPGTELGSLRGKVAGKFGDFAWVNPWTALVRESVWQSLCNVGMELCSVQAELGFKNQPHESFFELEALPQVQLANALENQACEICGRVAASLPEKLVLDANSFDESIAVQRVSNLPTVMIINESFARFIQEKQLHDVTVIAIELQ